MRLMFNASNRGDSDRASLNFCRSVLIGIVIAAFSLLLRPDEHDECS